MIGKNPLLFNDMMVLINKKIKVTYCSFKETQTIHREVKKNTNR